MQRYMAGFFVRCTHCAVHTMSKSQTYTVASAQILIRIFLGQCRQTKWPTIQLIIWQLRKFWQCNKMYGINYIHIQCTLYWTLGLSMIFLTPLPLLPEYKYNKNLGDLLTAHILYSFLPYLFSVHVLYSTVQCIPRDYCVFCVVLASQKSQNKFENLSWRRSGLWNPRGRGDNQSINTQKNGEKMEGRKI